MRLHHDSRRQGLYSSPGNVSSMHMLDLQRGRKNFHRWRAPFSLISQTECFLGHLHCTSTAHPSLVDTFLLDTFTCRRAEVICNTAHATELRWCDLAIRWTGTSKMTMHNGSMKMKKPNFQNFLCLLRTSVHQCRITQASSAFYGILRNPVRVSKPIHELISNLVGVTIGCHPER